MEVTPDQYTMHVTDDKCSFCLEASTDNAWKLGTAFLKDWYMVYDINFAQVGFAPHIQSWRPSPPEAVTEEPTRNIYSYANELI